MATRPPKPKRRAKPRPAGRKPLAAALKPETRTYRVKVLGKTLEHLGKQMYKHREAAIAELVANSWDAGATAVFVTVPEPATYNPLTDVITIQDNGSGMDPDAVQDEYLIVGRNRRSSSSTGGRNRPVMGRKGIGKLAGFGIAERMTVLTWRDGTSTEFALDAASLKEEDNQVADVKIQGKIGPAPSGSDTSGTKLTLTTLKQVTPLDVEKLREALSRKFSRRVRGEMTISVNLQALAEPKLDIEYRSPKDGFHTVELEPGKVLSYYYAFSKETIKSTELRGFAVYVRGKTAQAPPFFFDVEGTASGQHATRYVTGDIEADFIDQDPGDSADVVSTDRQEIDWEAATTARLYEWGQELSRRVLIEWTERRSKKLIDWVEADAGFAARIGRLDPVSRKQITGFLKSLAQVEQETERARDLVDSLIRAYEFRQFHDVTTTLESVGDDPEALRELLARLYDWKVLESRAVLEIVKGRLEIIDKFERMIVNDAPETAPAIGKDNLHDLIAGYPWLLEPEWQVLAEEKRITTQLREWQAEDEPNADQRERYDFLALADPGALVVVEIKRPGYAITLDDLQRVERYKERLARARPGITMAVVGGGAFEVSPDVLDVWRKRSDARLWTWADLFKRARATYEHWRAVLEGDVTAPTFAVKEEEIAQTKKVLQTGTVYRGKEARAAGLGPQDSEYQESDEGPSDEDLPKIRNRPPDG